jgi:hypothetical protein
VKPVIAAYGGRRAATSLAKPLLLEAAANNTEQFGQLVYSQRPFPLEKSSRGIRRASYWHRPGLRHSRVQATIGARWEEPEPGSAQDIGLEIGRMAHLLFPTGVSVLVEEKPCDERGRGGRGPRTPPARLGRQFGLLRCGSNPAKERLRIPKAKVRREGCFVKNVIVWNRSVELPDKGGEVSMAIIAVLLLLHLAATL